MTFTPEQIVETNDWLAQHADHEIVDDVKEYELAGGTAVKVLRWHHCKTCGKSHLYEMTTEDR